ncbi:MAG: SurA N-terminal domain-containing protein [Planctomycetales bacterium]
MQSPFKIFRKYQKVFLAALALMAMIAFGVGDQLSKMMRSNRTSESEVVVETSAGELTQIMLKGLARRRQIANAFLTRALFTANPMFQAFERSPRVVQRLGSDSPQDLVFAWLMGHEARRMGLVVSDEQVESFIRDSSRIVPGFEFFTRENKTLSGDQYRKILKDMSLGGKDLYEMLREELLAQQAFRLLSPMSPPAPEQYWRYYQQLQTRQVIEAAALPVTSFAAELKDPPEEELARLFEEHKKSFDSSGEGEYRPGFRQPTKVSLQYLQIGYADVEEQVARDRPVTDEEIEAYYEARKELDSRLHEVEVIPPAGSDTTPIEPEFAPETDGETTGPALGSEDSRPEPPASPTDAEPTEATPNRDSGETPCGPVPGGILTPQEDSQPAPLESATEDPAAKNADEPSADKPEEASPQAEAAEEEADANEDPSAPLVPSEEMPEETPEEMSEETKPAPKPPTRKLKYKPLDDDLKDLIRSSLLHERTLEGMRELSNTVAEQLRDSGLRITQKFGFDLVHLKPQQAEEMIETAREDMQRVAREHGLKFEQTELVSATELRDLSGIGKAQESGSQESSAGGGRDILDLVFRGEALCSVQVAESPTLGANDSRQTYLFWKVQQQASHVPASIDEPGVRNQVVIAWKTLHAIPLARQRAQRLAEQAREEQQSLVDALSQESITGAQESLKLTILTSPEFARWRESTAASPSSMSSPPLQLSNPLIVIGAGLKFMDYVFDELQSGEVGVVFNDDSSVCYIVRIKTRRDADREAFKTAPLFTGMGSYSQLAERDIQSTRLEFSRQIQKKYVVKWRDSDAAALEAVGMGDDE